MVRKHTQEQFLEKAKAVHGDTYDYTKAAYSDTKGKIIIACASHGDFLQSAEKHVSGQGCPECATEKNGKSKRTPVGDFVNRSLKVHDGMYDYSLVDYVRALDKVIIICHSHGQFLQTPNVHLEGHGCPKCATDAIGKRGLNTLEHFLKVAEKVHGAKYDYSNFTYVTSLVKSRILCPVHGEFLQNPKSHMIGSGCPCCSQGGYTRNRPGKLYVLASNSYTKIGITNLSAKKRAKAVSKSCGEEFTVVLELTFEDGRTADDSETYLLKDLRQKYKSPTKKFDGHTECFIDVDIVELINRITDVVRTTEQINNQQLNFKE